ncbi:MAG: hypothetical protein ACI4GW_03770 [Lachnospiraceae bacterium]
MRLNRIIVSGDIGCEYEFGDVNVLLGDNNSGKSTLMKLILFSLGAPINSFIDEISQKKLCNNVTLEVTLKNGRSIRIIRKLPTSEAFLVTPVKSEEEIVNDEITVYNAEEFSDFLLESEGYSTEKIAYAKDKMASFRFYFLLRALYVDQDTSAHSILSDLNMGQEYFTSQPIIKKSIVEKMLGKDNSELQRIRIAIQELNKENTTLTAEVSFLKEQRQKLENAYNYEWKKLDAELLKISEEKELLADAEYEQLSKVRTINNSQSSSELILKQKVLKEKIENDQILKLEISDLENILKSLNEDVVALNFKIAAKNILEELPILYCPNCLSELSEDTVARGLCENCHKKTTEEKILNNATLKKTLNDSITEAQELLVVKRNMLHQNKAEIDRLEKEIQKERKRLFSESQVERNLIQESIKDIKQRLEYLIEKESVLKQYRKSKIDLEMAKERKKAISESLKENRELLLTADNKATTAMLHYDSFKITFSEYLKILFTEIDKCSLDENYMPLIDDNKMTMVSSASLKVAIRITYILALLNSNCGEDGSHVGFILLDSPKDKDLDDYRFEKFLGIIGKCCKGQILITGSVSDREMYKKELVNAKFFEELTTEKKLLR